MITFKLAPHTVLDVTVVEVWDDGKFLATIYPAVRGLQIISKYRPIPEPVLDSSLVDHMVLKVEFGKEPIR